jgi:hypothetical protein
MTLNLGSFCNSLYNGNYIFLWYMDFQLQPFHKLILIKEELIKVDFSNFSYMGVKVYLLNDVKRYQALQNMVFTQS